jgi:hypothetical protein
MFSAGIGFFPATIFFRGERKFLKIINILETWLDLVFTKKKTFGHKIIKYKVKRNVVGVDVLSKDLGLFSSSFISFCFSLVSKFFFFFFL